MSKMIRTDDSILKMQERASLSLRGLYRFFGYKQYKMSKFEEYDLYVRNKDFLVSDRVITFTGESGKLLALKPDVTLSIIKNAPESPTGINKIYYNETVYRSSGMGASNDFAEIMQTGLECFGSLDRYSVCEVVLLALRSLEQISDRYILDISHMGILSGLLDEAKLSGELRSKMLSCIGEKNRSGVSVVCREAGMTEELASRFERLVGAYGRIEDVIGEIGAICETESEKECFAELSLICDTLRESGELGKVCIDFSVVNDMRYYSGIVFRGYIDKVPTGILSGGRYDNLMKKMGRSGGAIGFAVYLDLLERLDDSTSVSDCDVFLIYSDENSPAEIYREANAVTALGETLISGKEMPEGLRCKRVVDIRKKVTL